MSPFGRSMIKLFGKLHRVLYQKTGSRLFANLGRMPNLLLTTTGRKSGNLRTTPLLYVKYGDGFAIVASFAGAPKHPSWYLNLQHNPKATVQIGKQLIPVVATTASPEVKKSLWPQLTAMYADYDDYEDATDRDIPVVLLSAEEKQHKTFT